MALRSSWRRRIAEPSAGNFRYRTLLLAPLRLRGRTLDPAGLSCSETRIATRLKLLEQIRHDERIQRAFQSGSWRYRSPKRFARNQGSIFEKMVGVVNVRAR